MERPRVRRRIGGRKLLGKTLKMHRRENFRKMTQPRLSKNLTNGRNIEGHALKGKPRPGLILDNRFIGRLERGEIEELEFTDLPFIADLYQISVISLVYSVSEEVPFAYNTLREKDYTPIPFEIPSTLGFRYLVPNYRLAGSSLILLILQLQPGGCSPRNHKKHKEDEVLEVIRGEVVVEFPANKVPLSVGDRIHYKNVEHVITNPSKDSEAIVFVQRELAELEEIRKVRV
jgi:mannose-6-phosphate isomerase-like protein (cupin superfamily)